MNGLTRDIREVVATERCRGRSDIGWTANASQRNLIERRMPAPEGRMLGIIAFILDKARRKTIDRNSIGSQLDRKRFGKFYDPGFGRNNMGALIGTDMGGDAADIDDAVTPACLQMRQSRTAAKECPIQNYGGDCTPLRIVKLMQRDGPPKGCIIDQDVEPPAQFYGLVDKTLNGLRIGDVTHHHFRLAAIAADFIDDPFSIRPSLTGMYHDGRAPCCEMQGDLAPDPSGAARGECNPACQFVSHDQYCIPAGSRLINMLRTDTSIGSLSASSSVSAASCRSRPDAQSLNFFIAPSNVKGFRG
jgi:hypothetical protein